MLPRTISGLSNPHLLQWCLSVSFFLPLGMNVLESRAFGQDPGFKVKEVKLKTEKEVGDKAKEKDKAKNGKSEKLDLAPLDEYYRDYLIPLLTQPSPEGINRARKEISDDLDALERNKDLLAKFNSTFIPQMRELALKDKDGKAYSPQARINAAVLLGRLNSSVSTGGVKTPEVGVQPVLASLIDQKDNDGLTSSALSTIARHVSSNAVSERGRKFFVEKLQTHFTSPSPPMRTPEAHSYLTEQVIECLTLIAKIEPDKEPSKLAVAALTPELVKIIEAQESEWLVESALLSLGAIKTVNLTPEAVLTIEKGIAKFAKQSLKDWKKRIANSSGSVASSGYPGGGMGGMGSSMGSSEGSSSESGYEGYGGAAAPKTNQKKNALEEQPKEVKNARRIAHQRFERIHYALNGAFRKPSQANATSEEKALLTLVAAEEKAKVSDLLAKVQDFQKELNDEKVKDLATLSFAVFKSVKGIRTACDVILGETKDPTASDTTEDPVFPVTP